MLLVLSVLSVLSVFMFIACLDCVYVIVFDCVFFANPEVKSVKREFTKAIVID